MAAEVGLLLSAYAIIDLFIVHIFAAVAEMNKDDAYRVLARIRGNSQRIDLISVRPETRCLASATTIAVRKGQGVARKRRGRVPVGGAAVVMARHATMARSTSARDAKNITPRVWSSMPTRYGICARARRSTFAASTAVRTYA